MVCQKIATALTAWQRDPSPTELQDHRLSCSYAGGSNKLRHLSPLHVVKLLVTVWFTLVNVLSLHVKNNFPESNCAQNSAITISCLLLAVVAIKALISFLFSLNKTKCQCLNGIRKKEKSVCLHLHWQNYQSGLREQRKKERAQITLWAWSCN